MKICGDVHINGKYVGHTTEPMDIHYDPDIPTTPINMRQESRTYTFSGFDDKVLQKFIWGDDLEEVTALVEAGYIVSERMTTHGTRIRSVVHESVFDRLSPEQYPITRSS